MISCRFMLQQRGPALIGYVQSGSSGTCSSQQHNARIGQQAWRYSERATPAALPLGHACNSNTKLNREQSSQSCLLRPPRHCSIRTAACSAAGDGPQTAPASGSPRAAPLTADEIQQRILLARQRKASAPSYHCPACDIMVGTPLNLAKHMERCCQDLWDKHAWDAVRQGKAAQHAPRVPRMQACRHAWRGGVHHGPQ